LPLSSLKTPCICSALGALRSHSRIRAVRSLDVCAENAPPVSVSNGWGSFVLAGICITSGAGAVLLGAGKGNMDRTNKRRDPGQRVVRVEALFSPQFSRSRNKKTKARSGWLKARPPGLTADTRSILSGLAYWEGKVPIRRGAIDCLHSMPGPLHHHYPEVGTGYCRQAPVVRQAVAV